MRFISSLFEKYPDVHIGVLVCRGLRNPPTDTRVEEAKKGAMDALKGKVGDAPVSRHPYIASWREMYRSFKTKAADYHPSVEALVRRALKEGALPQINVAVDAYNAVSVRHLVPMGGQRRHPAQALGGRRDIHTPRASGPRGDVPGRGGLRRRREDTDAALELP
jgi:DNA/RNA-binding domain of Phe-tRNA-synthetase-like protein